VILLKLIADLHAHSVYSGGVGTINLDIVDKTIPYKGIALVATGDVQFPAWKELLRKNLTEYSEGIYQLNKGSATKFLLQTEIIFTCQIGSKSKLSHTIILFKDFEVVDDFYRLMKSWGAKVDTMGRPFLVCKKGPGEVSDRVHGILDLEEDTELIPAHVLTPDGVYGSGVRINSLKDYYGEATDRIHAVETGLSADPQLLWLIPELDDKTLISNSDAHSAALHRIGREFTEYEIPGNSYTYHDVIKAIRENRVTFTAEFTPTEGRYFLTGHRGGRNKHLKKKPSNKGKRWHEDDEYCCYSPKNVPKNDTCPICGSRLKVGAFQRATEIGKAQGEIRSMDDYKETRKAIHMVPLAEIIAFTYSKGVNTKFVVKKYHEIITFTGTECDIWLKQFSSVKKLLQGKIDDLLLHNLREIHEGNFCFSPPGYDGLYGELKIGKRERVDNISVIQKRDQINSNLGKTLLDYVS